jgi:hypothetical protein
VKIYVAAKLRVLGPCFPDFTQNSKVLRKRKSMKPSTLSCEEERVGCFSLKKE